MYLRAVHAETSLVTLRQLIRSNPLGVLTTAIPSQRYPFILSSHIPWLLDVEDESSETELGTLRGHLARANPQSKTIIDNLVATSKSSGACLDAEVLVLFTAPTHHYITPKFYTETKPDTGKVVPTWNYAAAQAYGKARIYFDTKSPDTGAFLSKQIHDLSQHAEASVMGYDGKEGRQGAWKVADAPEKYIELLQKAIIGIEIKLDRLEGKFKMSQESTQGDREGVVKGFEALGSELGDRMAAVVNERGQMKTASKS
ncbi:transcriptional regulator PAI 2-type [Boeremia exigua]|uniref:transcriptional regulator PAI 2-type n=1 Tax=Boeremia exigua TaxID=749465 RepID=UPI001E8CFDE2|nr:transcriptional regulator PAI 2-type [Boeremia exigua]KAH6622034.1 transcriptional regulator PAI 2-type [Boeremia exigua]